MCRGVSSPALHWHWAVTKPGTFRLCKNLASPMRPVRACTSKALSALRKSLCIRKMSLVGAESSKTSLRLPGSVPGRSGLSIFAVSACYLVVQSRVTSVFSFWSHCLSGPQTHSSAHFFRLRPGVLCCGRTVLCLCLRWFWLRSLLRITVHAAWMT